VCNLPDLSQIATTEEAVKIEWFTFEDIPRNTSEIVIERIADALFEPEKVHYKMQSKLRVKELSKTEGAIEAAADTLITDLIKTYKTA